MARDRVTILIPTLDAALAQHTAMIAQARSRDVPGATIVMVDKKREGYTRTVNRALSLRSSDFLSDKARSARWRSSLSARICAANSARSASRRSSPAFNLFVATSAASFSASISIFSALISIFCTS